MLKFDSFFSGFSQNAAISTSSIFQGCFVQVKFVSSTFRLSSEVQLSSKFKFNTHPFLKPSPRLTELPFQVPLHFIVCIVRFSHARNLKSREEKAGPSCEFLRRFLDIMEFESTKTFYFHPFSINDSIIFCICLFGVVLPRGLRVCESHLEPGAV